MTKKSVTIFRTGDGRLHLKVIKMAKLPKTGAYTPQREIVSNGHIQDFLKK